MAASTQAAVPSFFGFGMMKRADSGAVLIFVMGILFLLAVLGTTFHMLSRAELSISSNYLDEVRAKILARSGVDAAVREMRDLLTRDTRHFLDSAAARRSLMYFGSDVTETLAIPGVPLRSAQSPSFAVEVDGDPGSGSPEPLQVMIDGESVGFSGVTTGGTHGRNADLYTLKVVDTSSQIYLNDLDNLNLQRILDNLGRIPEIHIPALGERILRGRPEDGFRSKHQLTESILTNEEFERIQNFVCVHTWVDRRVCNPVPLSPTTRGYAAGLTERRPVVSEGHPVQSTSTDGSRRMYRYGRNPDYYGQPNPAPLEPFDQSRSVPASTVYGWDELNPQYIEITSRAPVNINTASREVLLALIDGLDGFFVMDSPAAIMDGYYWLNLRNHYRSDPTISPRFVDSESGGIGMLYRTQPFRMDNPEDMPMSAHRIVDAILSRRSVQPFRHWEDFNAFVDSLVGPGGPIWDTRSILRAVPVQFPSKPMGDRATRTLWTAPLWVNTLRFWIASQAAADVLKANFNPNLHLNELNPNQALHTYVDKTDLIHASTEFCFLPTGCFEITAMGRVLLPVSGDDSLTAPNNRELARHSIQTVVQVYDLVRHATQSDFYGGDLMQVGNPDFRPDISRFVNYHTNNNLPLETGPEPDNGLAPRQNEYEGYVQLASLGGVLPVPSLVSSPVAGMTHKPRDAVWDTPRGGRAHGERAHGHFVFDADLHYARAAAETKNDAKRRSLTRNWNREERVPYQGFYNWPDWSEQAQPVGTRPLVGPYGYNDDPELSAFRDGNPESRIRIARSYRSEGGRIEGVFAPPSDLRIDGLYSERGSAPIYWPGSAGLPTSNGSSNLRVDEGVVCYWMKPGFDPALASKVHTWFSVSRLHQLSREQTFLGLRNGRLEMIYREQASEWWKNWINPSPFAHYLFPRYPKDPDDPMEPVYRVDSAGPRAVWNIPANSMGFGYGFSWNTGHGTLPPASLQGVTSGEGAPAYNYVYNPGNQISGGVITPSLNRSATRARPNDAASDPLQFGKWMHVTLSWSMDAPTVEAQEEIRINGSSWVMIDGSMESAAHPFVPDRRPPLNDSPAATWFLDDFNPRGIVRRTVPEVTIPSEPVGGPDLVVRVEPGDEAPRFFPDLGLNPIRIGEPQVLNPGVFDRIEDSPHARLATRNFSADSTVDELFIWGDMDEGRAHALEQYRLGRYYRNNDGMFRSPAIDVRHHLTSRELALPGSGLRLLGVSWTQSGCGYDANRAVGRRFDVDNLSGETVSAPITMLLSVDDGDNWVGRAGGIGELSSLPERMIDSSWSAALSADGNPLEIQEPWRIRYAALFETEADPLNTVLIETPLLDDVILYVMSERPRILETLVLSE
jgi:hypothetical protein